MKKVFTYSAIVLLLASTACNKTDSITSGENAIRFAAASVDTRALIEDAAALQAQTFQVYDLLDGASYINDVVSYADGAWNYASGATYTWKTGTHKFFGHTEGAGTLADNKLEVTKVLTTADADQTDLLYSAIYSTTAEAWKADETHEIDTPVALHFKHLFTAVSFMIKNCTDSEVTLNSVSGPALPNSATATVDFSGDETAVTYGTPSVSGSFVTATALSDVSVAAQGLVDVLTQASATEKTYFMVWPQTLPEGEDAVTVTVSYTMNGTAYTGKVVKLPADTWEAGQKYDYVLEILPTDVRLTFKVQPWEQVSSNINTSIGSINMSNVTWMNSKVTVDGEEVNTVVNAAYSVYMYYHPTVNGSEYTANNGYFPAQAYFTVNYPKSGKYKIGLIPAYGQTEDDLDASKYEIYIYKDGDWVAHDQVNGEDISMDTVYFQVRAAADQDGAEHKAQIDIWFKPEGSDEWISAYSEVRANYALIIPATN